MAQEIWFRSDLGHIIDALDGAPVPGGDYGQGWRDSLAALAVAIGIEKLPTHSAPQVWIVPNDRQLGAPAN